MEEAENEAESCRKEITKITEERIEEQKSLTEALEGAMIEKTQLESKWNSEFEQLRTFNSDREEHLLEDCEWKIRSMEKKCKEKIDLAENNKKEAEDKARQMGKLVTDNLLEVEHLKTITSECQHLRGLTGEQRDSLKLLTQQMDDLKTAAAEANLKAQAEIANCKNIKRLCDM